MRGQPIGNPVFFSLFPMTIKASPLLPLGIKEGLGLGIVFVVAVFTLLLIGLDMPEVQRFIHADRLPVAERHGIFHMALAASHRSAGVLRTLVLFVTGNALVMVQVHHRLLVLVLDTLKFERQSIDRAACVVRRGGSLAVDLRVASQTILVHLRGGLGVLVVVKDDRRPFKRSKSSQGVDDQNVRPTRAVRTFR